jgi:hypothetical protein
VEISLAMEMAVVVAVLMGGGRREKETHLDIFFSFSHLN